MEQLTQKQVNNCWDVKISFYLETSCGQNSNPYLKSVHFIKTAKIRHLWESKMVIFLHRFLICATQLLQMQYFLVSQMSIGWI
jgi:hypothetical protein